MPDRNGHPTILEQKQRGARNAHPTTVYTNCRDVYTGRRQLSGSDWSFLPSRGVAKRVGTKKSVRPKATYRGAKRNQRRVVRTLQLEAKRARHQQA